MALAPRLLALVALVFLAAAARADRVDAEVAFDGVNATLREVVHLETPDGREVRLVVPDGFAPGGAADARGALATTQDGDAVRIATRAASPPYAFEVTFHPLAPPDPARLVVPVVAGPADATSARVRFPEGWHVGSFAAEGTERSEDGVLRGTGPFTATAVLSRREAHVLDLDAFGADRVRVVNVSIGKTGVVAHVTDHQDRAGLASETYLVPSTATFVGAAGEDGPLEATQDDDTLTVRFDPSAPPRALVSEWTYEASQDADEVHTTGLSIPARPGDVVLVNVTARDGFRIMSAATASSRTGPWTFEDVGPVHVTVTYLAPTLPGRVRFERAPLIVLAPEDIQADARRVLDDASRDLASAAWFAGTANLSRAAPIAVVYTDEPIFTWEEGHYRPGTNVTYINASHLRGDGGIGKTAPERFAVERTLLHEVTHALVDRRWGDLGSSFVDEGLARLAETHAEYDHLDDVTQCSTSKTSKSCTIASARGFPEALAAVTDFDPEWTYALSEADRAAAYTYSGFLFLAYEARSPPGALPTALDDLAGRLAAGASSSEAVDAFLDASPELTASEFLHPVEGQDEERVRGCYYDLVAPAFPWEDFSRHGDCPAPKAALKRVTSERATRLPAHAPAFADARELRFVPREWPAPPPALALPPVVDPPAPAPVDDVPGADGSSNVRDTSFPGLAAVAVIAVGAWIRRR